MTRTSTIAASVFVNCSFALKVIRMPNFALAAVAFNYLISGISAINAKHNAAQKVLKHFCEFDTEHNLPAEFGNKIEE